MSLYDNFLFPNQLQYRLPFFFKQSRFVSGQNIIPQLLRFIPNSIFDILDEKLKMVKDPDTGKQVPFFTVDGEGKAGGGQAMVPKTKGYFKGGRTMSKGGVAGGAKKKPPGMRYGGFFGGLAGHTPKPFPGKRGVDAPPRVKRGGKG